MEMQSHHRIKRGDMEVHEQREDRLSRLPDDILHSILRGLPLKHAARTSALSRRWARTWLRALASSRVLDFTDHDFARGQAPARAAATVSRCLQLHAEYGAPLDVFRLAVTAPGSTGAFERDVVGWVASAVARGAREVEVDLRPPLAAKADAGDESAAFVELPGDLFVATSSLARLALGGFRLRAVPAGLAEGLRSLSLSHADVTDEAVRDIVSSCRALEVLSLRSCNLLRSVRIAGETLRSLEIVRCLGVRELRVNAPSLESFAFHGDNVYSTSDDDDEDLSSAVDLGSTPALRDAYLSHIGFDDAKNAYDEREYAYSNFLSCVAYARVLTLCSVGLLVCSRKNPSFESGKMPSVKFINHSFYPRISICGHSLVMIRSWKLI